MKRRPTTVKQIHKQMHSLNTSSYRSSQHVSDETFDDTMVAIRKYYNTIVKSTPRAAIFSRDMLFNNPYIADWNKIGRRRLKQVKCTNKHENSHCLPHNYAKDEGPYVITQVCCNVTVRIQKGSISEHIHIRRLTPYIEES